VTNPYDYEAIAKMIDHSLLNPSLTARELEEGCALAVRYNTASVCIMPYYLARCAEVLAGTTVRASTTIGFPHGGTPLPQSSLKPGRRSRTVERNWM
jgi:deoxyribose-phosphate aldolase